MAALKMEPFSMNGNVAENWRRWKSDFSNYLIGNELDEKSDKRKIAVFLMTCGEDLKCKFAQLEVEPVLPATEVKFEQVLAKFDDFFKSFSNEIFSSYLFWNSNFRQLPEEKFDVFYNKVKQHAIDCNFGNSLSRNIRDKLLIGISNSALRERLMREKTPSEKIVVEQCRISELSHSQSNCMSSASVENQEVSIDFIKKRKFQIKNTNQNQTCNKCGRLHDPRRCPAYGDECNNCGKLNHWAKKCRSSPKYKKNLLQNKNNYNHVHQIQTGNDNHDEGEVFTISTLAGKSECSSKDWLVNAFIDGNLINCKLDTGAQSNVISVNCLQQFKNKPNVLTTKDILKAFGGSVIKLVGQCYLQVELNGIKCKQRFLVTYLDVKTILGLEACRYFKLINKKKYM